MKSKAFSWKDKTVLVTGGTGSFGKKLAEIMMNELHPKKLIVFSRDELKQHEMRSGGFNHPSMRYFFGRRAGSGPARARDGRRGHRLPCCGA